MENQISGFKVTILKSSVLYHSYYESYSWFNVIYIISIIFDTLFKVYIYIFWIFYVHLLTFIYIFFYSFSTFNNFYMILYIYTNMKVKWVKVVIAIKVMITALEKNIIKEIKWRASFLGIILYGRKDFTIAKKMILALILIVLDNQSEEKNIISS